LGGGFPLGAFISSSSIMKTLSYNPALGHITTFGGHAVSCAASLAAIKLIESDNLIEEVLKKETIIYNILDNTDGIKQLRGKGLLFAIELNNHAICQTVIADCIAQGLIADWFLFAPECVRFAPPLTISYENLTKALVIMKQIIIHNTI